MSFQNRRRTLSYVLLEQKKDAFFCHSRIEQGHLLLSFQNRTRTPSSSPQSRRRKHILRVAKVEMKEPFFYSSRIEEDALFCPSRIEDNAFFWPSRIEVGRRRYFSSIEEDDLFFSTGKCVPLSKTGGTLLLNKRECLSAQQVSFFYAEDDLFF